MIKLTQYSMIAALFFTTLISCKGNQSPSDNSSSEEATTKTALEGTWLLPCQLGSDGNYTQTAFNFNEDVVTLSLTEYFESRCTETVRVVHSATADFEIGAQVTTADGFIASELNYFDDHSETSLGDGYDLFYLNSDKNELYFGLKDSQHPGSSNDTRPIYLDFNNLFINNKNLSTNVKSLFENLNSLSIPDGSYDGTYSYIDVERNGESGKTEIEVNIQHSWACDLTLVLISPNGQKFTLQQEHGGVRHVDLYKTFTLDLTGTNSLGKWSLYLEDGTGGHSGRLLKWSINFNQ